jgi:hypothetical protein
MDFHRFRLPQPPSVTDPPVASTNLLTTKLAMAYDDRIIA